MEHTEVPRDVVNQTALGIVTALGMTIELGHDQSEIAVTDANGMRTRLHCTGDPDVIERLARVYILMNYVDATLSDGRTSWRDWAEAMTRARDYRRSLDSRIAPVVP